MSPELHKVMNLPVKTVNYFKENTFASRFSVVLFERLDADHFQLSFSEVRWLLREHELNCLSELRKVHTLLKEQNLLSITLMVTLCSSGLFYQIYFTSLINSIYQCMAKTTQCFKKKLLWK